MKHDWALMDSSMSSWLHHRRENSTNDVSYRRAAVRVFLVWRFVLALAGGCWPLLCPPARQWGGRGGWGRGAWSWWPPQAALHPCWQSTQNLLSINLSLILAACRVKACQTNSNLQYLIFLATWGQWKHAVNTGMYLHIHQIQTTLSFTTHSALLFWSQTNSWGKHRAL